MADSGTGATLTFSGFTYNLTSISHNDMSREAIATSHLGTTTGATFIPGDIPDWGSIECELQWDTEDPLTNDPPLADAAGTLTLTFPLVSGDSAAATLVISAFCTGFSYTLPLEDLSTGTATFKVSGDPTWTNAS